jgi:hypothetical protein
MEHGSVDLGFCSRDFVVVVMVVVDDESDTGFTMNNHQTFIPI